MDNPTQEAAGAPAACDLKRRVARFQAPVPAQGILQSLTSIGGFLAVCAAMYAVAAWSSWAALGLTPLAAGFLVRVFIIQHDCGHASFVRSRRVNDALGYACSLLTLTPYRSWRRQHAGHHAVWNNLDRRDTGADFYSTCLTVAEYRARGAWRRFWYRATRHPAVANILVPPLVFLVLYRLPFDMPASWRGERRGVHLTNAALAALIGGLGLLVGFDRVATVQLPTMVLASIIGVWLFSVQHRSERSLWARDGRWTATAASLRGSSYLRLPRVLQWFTGNIGLHHVHHLNPRVPNYRLRECLDAIPDLASVPAMSLWGGLKALRCVLWDEDRQAMVTVRAAARPRA
jgi:omega-6 fatty acid desaturase (delta-12 desaturase)